MAEEFIKFWAELSNRYDSAIDNIMGEKIRPKIQEKLNEEDNLGNLIELGCGTGYFTKTLANKSESIISTDISEEMLSIARENLKGFEFQVMDCQDCKFNEGTFDTVFMGLVLLFTEPEKALKESRRILKPGGLLIIAGPDISFLSFYGNLKFRFKALVNYRKIPTTGHFLNQEKIVDMLDKTGFEVVSKEIIRDETDPNYVTVNYIKAKPGNEKY
ncbi:methyltransferase domain-containing protein [Methanobacterium sp.]|uniref:class I SAM-dependent methyltransferase n=1 Tax=Methanobacterium sp. TaxID=2164 RepID=UPI0031589813